MNYELAKKLKEAGFPQDKLTPDELGLAGVFGKEPAHIPTLSELIEVCGESLYSLTRHGNIWQTNWKDGFAGETAGSTPEEAVANLYLALNAK